MPLTFCKVGIWAEAGAQKDPVPLLSLNRRTLCLLQELQKLHLQHDLATEAFHADAPLQHCAAVCSALRRPGNDFHLEHASSAAPKLVNALASPIVHCGPV